MCIVYVVYLTFKLKPLSYKIRYLKNVKNLNNDHVCRHMYVVYLTFKSTINYLSYKIRYLENVKSLNNDHIINIMYF